MKKSEKLLIFDFDGTIADTKSLYYKAILDELKPFKLSKDKIDSAIDIGFSLRRTIRNLGFTWLYTFFIHRSIMKRIIQYASQVKKCHDAESIKNIKGKKILISNSLREFVTPILKHLELTRYFDEIYGADDFDDKEEFIKEYMKKKRIAKKDCYYIADRAADVILARDIGCMSVIISGKCAWNSRKQILKENPNFIISDLKELREII